MDFIKPATSVIKYVAKNHIDKKADNQIKQASKAVYKKVGDKLDKAKKTGQRIDAKAEYNKLMQIEADKINRKRDNKKGLFN